MTETKQFDGLNKAEALRECLKDCPALLMHEFEFDSDTQIATYEKRGTPIIETGKPESDESKSLNLAAVAMREAERDYQEKTLALNSRERELREKGYQLAELEKAIDVKQANINQSIAELEKLKLGLWGRTKSFFHRQT